MARNMAGHRAMAEAKREGGNPAALDALAFAAAGTETIAGVSLNPCTQGTIIAMQMAGDLFEDIIKSDNLGKDEAELVQTGIAAIIFRDSVAAYRELRTNGIANIYREAMVIIWEMPLEESMKLTGHVQQEIAIFNRLNGQPSAQPGKPVESGGLSDKRSPQPVTPSQPSTGLCPTTDSASTMPSGHSQSPQPYPCSQPATSEPVETPDPTTQPAPALEHGTVPELSSKKTTPSSKNLPVRLAGNSELQIPNS